jgi:hypothetical protein
MIAKGFTERSPGVVLGEGLGEVEGDPTSYYKITFYKQKGYYSLL